MQDWDKEDLSKQTGSYFIGGVKRLWKLIEPERENLKKAFALWFCIQILAMLIPYSFKLILDRLPNVMDNGITAVWVFLAMMFVGKGTDIALGYLVMIPKYWGQGMINLESLWPVMAQKKLLALSVGYHERTNTGKKVAKINKGCEKLDDLMSTFFWQLAPAVMQITIGMGFLLTMDAKIGVLFIIPLVASIAISIIVYYRFRAEWVECHGLREEASGFFNQSLVNVQTVQAYGQEAWEIERLTKVLGEWARRISKAHNSEHRYFFLLAAINHMSFFAIVGIALHYMYEGRTTVGTVAFLFATGSSTLDQIRDVMQGYAKMMKNFVAAYRMTDLLAEPVEIANPKDAIPLTKPFQEIRFEDVDFRYDTRANPVLSGFNLAVRRGEVLALVAASGEGKTTTTKHLNRIIDATEGRVLIDGVDVRLVDRDQLRRKFAVMKQDVDIFDDTVEGNVKYGSPEATDEQVLEAIRTAHLGVVLTDKKKFPAGLQTLVGENGVMLSGGERQRVGIARAYLRVLTGAEILLLDEATSHLDSESEGMILQAIHEIMERPREAGALTIVAIAHRLSTIQRADRICVMEGGKITEEGDHVALMRKNGLYAKLVTLQRLGGVVDDTKSNGDTATA